MNTVYLLETTYKHSISLGNYLRINAVTVYLYLTGSVYYIVLSIMAVEDITEGYSKSFREKYSVTIEILTNR